MIEKVQEIQLDFQRGFKSIHVSVSGSYLPKFGMFDFPQDAEIAQNFELRGEGESFDEALKEWKEKLKSLPQEGRLLYWRVVPEIHQERNFDTKTTRWQVYARGSILT